VAALLGKAPRGDAGIIYIRALINDISSDSVKFANDINQRMTGGPFVNVLPSGTVEIIYQQDTDATVTQGIGVDENPNLDRLIASGSWLAVPRPKFGQADAVPDVPPPTFSNPLTQPPGMPLSRP
jgi:hypothetical protein